MSNRDQESQGFSRRNFIKGGLVAGATGLGLSFSDKMVFIKLFSPFFNDII